MSLAAWVVIVVVLLFLALAIFCAGHWLGYGKGESDALERVKFFQRNESRGVTREEYFKNY
jgi:hypothetical protein